MPQKYKALYYNPRNDQLKTFTVWTLGSETTVFFRNYDPRAWILVGAV